MSTGAFVLKMLALLFVCGSPCIWGSDKAEKVNQVVPGRFLLLAKTCTRI